MNFCGYMDNLEAEFYEAIGWHKCGLGRTDIERETAASAMKISRRRQLFLEKMELYISIRIQFIQFVVKRFHNNFNKHKKCNSVICRI